MNGFGGGQPHLRSFIVRKFVIGGSWQLEKVYRKVLELSLNILIKDKRVMSNFLTSDIGYISRKQPAGYTQSEFLLDNFQIKYSNRYWILELPQSATNQVLIENFICQQIGEILKKKTCIQIGRKLVVLEDNYEFADRQGITKNNSQSDALTTWSCKNKSEGSIQEGDDGQGRRDRKNLVKNIVKSYELWIKKQLQETPDSKLQDCKKSLNKLIQKTKFNNLLISQIIASSLLRTNFQAYLSSAAIDWLNSSKIKDKISHRQAIQIYKKSCITGKYEYTKSHKSI